MEKSDISNLKDKIMSMTIEECAVLVSELREELTKKGIDLSSMSFGGSSSSNENKEVAETPRNLVLSKIPSDLPGRFPLMKVLTKILNISVLEAKKKLDNMPVVLKTEAISKDLEEMKKEFADMKDVEVSLA